MNTRTFATIMQSFTIIGKALLAALLLFVTFYATPAEAQATDPSATATIGVLRIGTGNFTEYKPTHIKIHAGDSVLQDVIGNLQMGTDSSGKECTLDPNQPAPAWSWTYTSTYSTDGTNYEPIGSNGSLSVTGGQTGKLFGTFSNGGYFKIKFIGHVTFYTNCKSGAQSLNTIELEENFSADKQDFDFSVSDIAINQGEDGTFFSTLTSINGFTGTINFSNPDPNDPLFGVTGSGSVSPPMLGTAPITIHVGSGAVVGSIYAVGIRGKSNVGPTTIFHDKVANITVLKRQAWITYGATYSRLGLNQPQLNPEGAGITNGQGDTLYTTNPMTFTPNYSGYWSPNSAYAWTTSPTNFSSLPRYSGTFITGTIPIVNGFFPVPKPGDTNFVTLSLQDSILSPGIDKTASAGYTMRFHHTHENFYTDTKKTVTYPTILQPGGYSHPINPYQDWTFLFLMDNPTSIAQTTTLGAKLNGSVTASVTMGFSFGLTKTLTNDDKEQIGKNTSITVGATVTAELSASTVFTAAPYTRTYFYWSPTSQVKGGTCTVWGGSGYLSDDSWTGRIAASPNIPATGQAVVFQYPGYKP